MSFMSADIAKLNKRVEQFCSSPSPLFLDETQSLLKELLKAFCYEEDFLRRNKLEQLLGMMRRSSETDVSTYAHVLHSIAFEEYEAGDIDFAEYLFRSACDLVDDISLNNNLAYVLRRKRDDSINDCEVITLLLPGIQEREPFCLINMSLLFALSLSTPDDWRTADDLFALLPNGLSGADSWWEKLGKNNETEGYLVHFFLLRHDKIEHSNLGSIKSIAVRLKRELKGFPEWLASDALIETFDDVIECLDDPDFDTILEDFLKKMHCSRESVDKMLETVSALDLWPVYNKLLTDCVALLSQEELAKLKADYKEKFSIPLPGEVDGDLLPPSVYRVRTQGVRPIMKGGSEVMTDKTTSFTVLDENGKETKCEVLFTFVSEETGKSYIVYTDNSVDGEGNTQVFASIYNPDSEKEQLTPIETDKEWKIIEIILEELQSGIKEENEHGSQTDET